MLGRYKPQSQTIALQSTMGKRAIYTTWNGKEPDLKELKLFNNSRQWTLFSHPFSFTLQPAASLTLGDERESIDRYC